ncbi:MAG: hypothetical protein F6K56_21275 [Moorea sp. SIO3G5]|nr:hypothetical protein [Moorena sp. SIO3G5]
MPVLDIFGREGQDIIKVFATVGTTDFHWLELPALDQPIMAMSGRRSENPLEELLAAIAAEQPPTKNVALARYPAADWITKQVVIRTKLTPSLPQGAKMDPNLGLG